MAGRFGRKIGPDDRRLVARPGFTNAEASVDENQRRSFSLRIVTGRADDKEDDPGIYPCQQHI